MVRAVVALILLASGWLASGCVAHTEQVRRTALVPPPAAPPRSGQPVPQGHFELSGYSSSAIVPVEPREADFANAGLYLARYNFGGIVRWGTGRDFDVGFFHQRSLNTGAMAAADKQGPKPEGTATLWGFSSQYAPEVSPGLRIAVALDTAIGWAPYFETRTCLDCPTPRTTTDNGRESYLYGRLATTVSYSIKPFAFFGGLSAANHPTNVESEVETTVIDNSDQIREGPIYVTAQVGCEFALGNGLKAAFFAQQPLSRSVVSYGPSLGLAFAVDFGGRNAPPQQQQTGPPGL